MPAMRVKLIHAVTMPFAMNAVSPMQLLIIRSFLLCLVTVGVFGNIEGRNAALAGQPELALGWISGPGLVPVGDRRSNRQHANLHPPPERYYGAERPDAYGYGYYQPYRPYKYSRP